MNDWIGLGIILLILIGGFVGVSYLGAPPKEISQEEYEKRVRQGTGMIGAAVTGLQNILEPAAKRAVEVQQDFRQGYYDGEQESGEGDDNNSNKPGQQRGRQRQKHER